MYLLIGNKGHRTEGHIPVWTRLAKEEDCHNGDDHEEHDDDDDDDEEEEEKGGEEGDHKEEKEEIKDILCNV